MGGTSNSRPSKNVQRRKRPQCNFGSPRKRRRQLLSRQIRARASQSTRRHSRSTSRSAVAGTGWSSCKHRRATRCQRTRPASSWSMNHQPRSNGQRQAARRTARKCRRILKTKLTARGSPPRRRRRRWSGQRSTCPSAARMERRRTLVRRGTRQRQRRKPQPSSPRRRSRPRSTRRLRAVQRTGQADKRLQSSTFPK